MSSRILWLEGRYLPDSIEEAALTQREAASCVLIPLGSKADEGEDAGMNPNAFCHLFRDTFNGQVR